MAVRGVPGIRMILVVAMLCWSGCRTRSKPEVVIPDDICRQTYEFGNFGCAGLVVKVEGSVGQLPASYHCNVWSAPILPRVSSVIHGAWDSWYNSLPPEGVVPLRLTRWEYEPTDTVTVIVVAEVTDATLPPEVGKPEAIIASDSVYHVIRFAPVGQRPNVDTVRLALHRK